MVSVEVSPRESHKGLIMGMVPLVVALFFIWGFITVLNDPLIAKLKGMFSLNYAEVMLTQTAFFLGYLIFSIPAGIVLTRVGYLRTIVVGLMLMALGYLLFVPSAMAGTFAGFLCALFVSAAGITTLQVAANPYISKLGSSETSSSRLTLAQGFNSLGTFIGPFFGAVLFLKGGVDAPTGANAAEIHAARVSQAMSLLTPILTLTAILVVVALVFWFLRNAKAPSAGEEQQHRGMDWKLLKKPRLMLGVLAIFFYLGAEVSVGSGLTNYLMQGSVIGHQAANIGAQISALFHLSSPLNGAQVAGTLVSVYWGLATLGRFLGFGVLARVDPGKVLAFNAIVGLVLAVATSQSLGMTAAVTALLMGAANSIMFPTIFTQALIGLHDDEVSGGSSLLVMAICGGAIFPVIFGAIADVTSLATAFIVPGLCYVVVLVFGIYTVRHNAALRRAKAA